MRCVHVLCVCVCVCVYVCVCVCVCVCSGSPEQELTIIAMTDASNVAVGAVLQQYIHNQWHGSYPSLQNLCQQKLHVAGYCF